MEKYTLVKAAPVGDAANFKAMVSSGIIHKALADVLQDRESQESATKHLQNTLVMAGLALEQNPYLYRMNQWSLIESILYCADTGLSLAKAGGEAYLVPFAGECTFMPGYKGLIKLAYQTGWVSLVEAHSAYESDDFDYELGTNKWIRHKPSGIGRTDDKITHFYCVITSKYGDVLPEVMTKSEVDAVKAGVIKKNKGKLPLPWKMFYSQMGKKTAVRRAMNYIPKSSTNVLARALEYDNRATGWTEEDEQRREELKKRQRELADVSKKGE